VIRISTVVGVSERSQVAEARRHAVECAEAQRLTETAVARAALVVTELATNLIKHGDGGTLLIGTDEDVQPSLVILALDKGRGIANLRTALQDGYSTAGSPGTGLGAISRSSTYFDVYSLPEKGTVVFCRIDGESAATPPAMSMPSRITVAGICIPKPGEEQSGDSWIAQRRRELVTITIADGLGHGDAAAIASLAVLRVIKEHPEVEIDTMLYDAHAAVRATRGAAVGIARIHPAAGRLDFAGTGNIAATIAADESTRKTVSLPGIVGHEMRKVQTFTYPWTESSVLVMHSDGLGTNWNLDSYPGLVQRDAAIIAGVIFRDFCRGTDDATVVVAKAS
jgi:anti-sigma regulatory factor (Ser/Thr protein kinase)